MVSGDFLSSLMMLCYCVLHVLRYSVHWNCCTEEMRSLLDLLEFEGSLARKLRFHVFHFRNLKEASHESFVFISSTTGFERSLARKLRFHIFHFWKLKEASHEIVVFMSSTFEIWRKPCTKASFSFLQLVEFERSLARNRRFYFFNSWNLKDASHESFAFIIFNSWNLKEALHESLRFAIQCLQIAMEWLRQGCSLRPLHA